MRTKTVLSYVGLTSAFALVLGVAAFAQDAKPKTLLNVSYDVARELYKDINPAFIAKWAKDKGGEVVAVNQSHGGSSKQAGAIIGGLEADVITMNQAPDIDILVERGALVSADWRKKFPNDAAPYSSISIFVVRKGNPKGIKNWDDLAKPGMQVIIPNPKVTGNGRYTFLAAYGYALKAKGSDEAAKGFVKDLFANVPVLDGGGRGATTTFAQRDIGDVLVTFENEATAISKEFGEGKFEVIYPSITIDAPAPVAVIDKVVDKKGSRDLATAYLNFLWSPEAQEIIAKNNFRPRDAAILAKNATKFPKIETFTVEALLGGWDKVQKTHFADGGTYDQIMAARR
ncbi:MAG: sulfate ABC transporter substrate-binding protein [Proteobacteria bacterium]|nr:sulfate ABC transporter substrate-binding protein [Pseudomonadota bacterium]